MVGYDIGKFEVYPLGESLSAYDGADIVFSNGRSYGIGGRKFVVSLMVEALGAYGEAKRGSSDDVSGGNGYGKI